MFLLRSFVTFANCSLIVSMRDLGVHPPQVYNTKLVINSPILHDHLVRTGTTTWRDTRTSGCIMDKHYRDIEAMRIEYTMMNDYLRDESYYLL